jgi:hypothetical protein
MKSIINLTGKHNGSPIVVIGGSPSLSEDLQNIPEDAISIAANEHAYKYGCRVDYFCFFKDHNESPNLMPYILDPKGAIRISKQEKWTDYLIDIPHFHRGFTGHLAVWLATLMTDCEVIICGMDLYTSDRSYYFDRPNDWEAVFPEQPHLEQWKRGIDNPRGPSFIDSSRIYATSGPLTKIFKTWTK